MGIFLGLGQPELPQPLLRHPIAQRVLDVRLGVHRGHIGGVVFGIFRHAHQRRPIGARAGVIGVKARIAQGRHDFPRAVGAGS